MMVRDRVQCIEKVTLRILDFFAGVVLLRKEVIQPQVPLRLPCYDFTPITNPTLDACLLARLAQRLQVLPTFVV